MATPAGNEVMEGGRSTLRGGSTGASASAPSSVELSLGHRNRHPLSPPHARPPHHYPPSPNHRQPRQPENNSNSGRHPLGTIAELSSTTSAVRPDTSYFQPRLLGQSQPSNRRIPDQSNSTCVNEIARYPQRRQENYHHQYSGSSSSSSSRHPSINRPHSTLIQVDNGRPVTATRSARTNPNFQLNRPGGPSTRPNFYARPQNDYNAQVAYHHHHRSSQDRRSLEASGRQDSNSRPLRQSDPRKIHHHYTAPTHYEMAPSATSDHGPSTRASHAGPEGGSHHHHHSSSKQTRSRTTIPTQSGNWILGKTIGSGSMGKVKLARKEDSNEQVACKIIPRGSTDDNHQSRADKERADQSKEIRTAREAAIVTLLNHPYICGLRDVVRTNYHWYMLFEYVNGGQMLDYIISHGKLKEKQARKFSRQIASALDYCHRNSIVHRDLKIENILIGKTGDIKIIDFGLSNLFSPRSHLKTFCGSLYFAAPELLQARVYMGPEVDVWSFGIVLYVLVCGKVPFDDQSMPALHAKIKKGYVDYPNWISSDCKHLMSRMLVTDPKQRATMQEVMNHPWMIKGFNGPPDNSVPIREPLTAPLDEDVINAMQGFNFGSPETINAQLLKIIESEEYLRAVKMYQKEKDLPPPKDSEKKRGFGFDFYKRRNSSNSRDTLTGPSSEGLLLGNDPLNAFSPLLSIYYLVKEKRERELAEAPRPSAPHSKEKEKEKEKDRRTDHEHARDHHREHRHHDHDRREVQVPELTPPQQAHTNSAAFEMPGETPTGGRSQPRARTQGEDDASEGSRQTQPPASEIKAEQIKKEGTAAGLLRRFSTRKRKEPERLDKDRSHPPVVQIHSPMESSMPRKSFSIRRGRRDKEDGDSGRSFSTNSNAQRSELLSPNPTAGERKSGLGRSTSVNSGDMRRRVESNGGSKGPPPTSGSDQSVMTEQPPSAQHRGHGHSKSVTMRAKSLGHARRESIQQRRMRREAAQEANVPEETDQELEQDLDQSGVSTDRLDNPELNKPVFLKGLFSVSTTSGKSVPAIRAEIRRVLKQLNVEYIEIKGGFNCKHSPSIDLHKIQEQPGSPAITPGHRRRFSFGGLMRGDDKDKDEIRDPTDRPPQTPRTPGRSDRNRSFSNSETSVDSFPRQKGNASRRAPGETSTQVQSDLEGNMGLEFEIFIVKVPLLTLHGIQFKRMTGNTWQFKNMADHILKELRL